jgi:Cof subfamily protein (haloacid dehalogenase superfamily)
MIKILAIDLDGTLYNSARQVSDRSRAALREALSAGLQPAIVTGRGRRGAEIALDTLQMDLPYICSAGALVRPGLDGETIHAWSFHAHQELLHVIKFTRHHESGLIAEPREGPPYWFGPDSMNAIMDPLTAREANKSIRTFMPEIDFDRPLLKVTITGSPEVMVAAEKLVRAECPSIHQVFSGIQYIDLTADGLNKGSALQALCEYYAVQPGQVAAIGDQDIDLHMLKVAGLPVAMQNGVPALKRIAHWIAPSNDDDGVAWTIDEILKLNDRERN